MSQAWINHWRYYEKEVPATYIIFYTNFTTIRKKVTVHCPALKWLGDTDTQTDKGFY